MIRIKEVHTHFLSEHDQEGEPEPEFDVDPDTNPSPSEARRMIEPSPKKRRKESLNGSSKEAVKETREEVREETRELTKELVTTEGLEGLPKEGASRGPKTKAKPEKEAKPARPRKPREPKAKPPGDKRRSGRPPRGPQMMEALNTTTTVAPGTNSSPTSSQHTHSPSPELTQGRIESQSQLETPPESPLKQKAGLSRPSAQHLPFTASQGGGKTTVPPQPLTPVLSEKSPVPQPPQVPAATEIAVLVEYRGLNYKFKGPFPSIDHLKGLARERIGVQAPFELIHLDPQFQELVVLCDLEELVNKMKLRLHILT